MLTEQEQAVMDMALELQAKLLELSGDHETDHACHVLSIRDIRSRVLACSDRRDIERREMERNAKPS